MSTQKIKKPNWICWALALILVTVIKIFSLNKGNVEAYYTYGLYPLLSKTFRFLFGWIPFSFGDILYILAACWLLYKLIKNTGLLISRGPDKSRFFRKVLNALLVLVFFYIIFNIFWGLNYNRQGIAHQLGIKTERYDTSDLIMVEKLLLQKVNASKSSLLRSHSIYPGKKELFKRAVECYDITGQKYSFLKYDNLSVKSSMYGWLGNYLGFTGYYNPFTGEAQVNTTVPLFLQPYITTHEMGHQLGYAKEDEASFAGYLASVNSRDTLFRYSAYLDLFLYANREVYFYDSVSSKKTFDLLITPVKEDILEWKKFSLSHSTLVAPAITWMYGKFLILNEQPKGMRSYNEVISMVIGYYKKYGTL